MVVAREMNNNNVAPKKQLNQNKKQMKNNSNKKQPRIPSVIPKKDHYQRSTYLYKLGSIIANKNIVKHDKSFDTLSRMYINHMDLVSKKAVLKLHPNIKRTICKQCSRIQIPGVESTCKLRLMNESKTQIESANLLVLKCCCGHVKRFPIGRNPEYELFSEREGIVHDSL